MDLFLPVKPTVLIVDDTPANISLLGNVLNPHYIVKAVTQGLRAQQVASEEQPDLILLDIMIPDLDGFKVCKQLKADPYTRHIPVIFLTSKTELKTEEAGMSLGAVDYITRPINPEILLSRVKAHFTDAATLRTMRVNNEYLEYEVLKRSRAMASLQQASILAMAALAEVRDQDTGNHLRRTQNYMRALGNHLKSHRRFAHYLTQQVIDILYQCAPLHDIGKVGIPDRILLKPGRYTLQEFEIMKTHPTLGWHALTQAEFVAGEPIEFLEIAKDIVLGHHEKWDGSGYPQGLKGDAIPIPARLMALADVYDALISKRIYKPGMSHEAATEIILEGRGTHFDPEVVDAFFALSEEFKDIAVRFADSDQELQLKADFVNSAIGDEFGNVFTS